MFMYNVSYTIATKPAASIVESLCPVTDVTVVTL